MTGFYMKCNSRLKWVNKKPVKIIPGNCNFLAKYVWNASENEV